MSLAISAAPWTNDTNNHTTTNRKRTPYSRRTAKSRAYPQQENYDIAPANDDRSGLFTDIGYYEDTGAGGGAAAQPPATSAVLQRINALESMENEGDEPADFSPPPKPELQQKRRPQPVGAAGGGATEAMEDVPVYVPNIPYPPPVSKIAAANDLGLYANYSNAFEPTRGLSPYVGGGGSSGATAPAPDSGGRMMEKINYMIHLLEESQHEKTNNVMEEVILYSFLGIFIIFICDAFARTGKYHR